MKRLIGLMLSMCMVVVLIGGTTGCPDSKPAAKKADEKKAEGDKKPEGDKKAEGDKKPDAK